MKLKGRSCDPGGVPGHGCQVCRIVPDGASRRGRSALIELAAEDLTLEEDHSLAGAHVVTQDDLTVGALPVKELDGASGDLARSPVQGAELLL